MPDHSCGQCWLALAPFAAIRAGFVYNDFSRALILPFKHGDKLHMTPVLGWFVTRRFTAMNDPHNLVIPILLHRHRYLLRRYNQSAKLARSLPTPDAFAPNMLQRRRHNKSQAGPCHLRRKKNVAGIFCVPHKYREILSGRPVTLVDDFIASGATLAAAARYLLTAGNSPVKGPVVACVL